MTLKKIITILFLVWTLNGMFLSPLEAQDKQEIVLTLTEITTGEKIEHFNKAGALRE